VSRASRRRAEREGGVGPRGPGLSRTGVSAGVGMGLLLLLAGVGWAGMSLSAGSHHPDPREGVTGSTVVSSTRYASYPRVKEVYSQAAEIAAILDGLYCYCDCSKHSGHRSLLTCFESDHGAACDICLTEAAIAYRMTKDGKPLDDIRDAIDELYGG